MVTCNAPNYNTQMKPKAYPRRKIAPRQRALAEKLSAYLSAQGERVAAEVVKNYMPASKSLLHGMLAKGLEEDMVAVWLKNKDMLVGWEEFLSKEITPEIIQIFKDAGIYAVSQLGVDEPITNLLNNRALTFAETRSAELVTKIEESTREMLRVTIRNAVEQGIGSFDLAKMIEDNNAFSPERADLIASYELGTALEEGNMSAWRDSGVVTGKEWITADDEIVSDDCQANAAQGVIGLEEEFQSGDMNPLAHPGCLPGDSVVSAFGVTAAYRRWFEGEIITIITASGNSMSATPNHPVLSDSGWIGIGMLKLGDCVYQCADPTSFISAKSPQNNYVKASVEQVTNALAMTSGMTTVQVPTTTENFHGDGIINSNVDIVLSASLLKNNIVSTEYVGDFDLTESGSPFILDSDCFFNHVVFRNNAPNSCGMSRSDLINTLLASHSRPFNGFGLTAGTQSNARCKQRSSNARSTDGKHSRQFQNGIAAQISLNHDIGGERCVPNAKSAMKSASFFQQASNCLCAHPDIIPDCAGGSAIEILRDDVVNIEVSNFSGYVFNLQTDTGWYFSGGIITHNCRCSVAPVVGSE